MSIASILHNRCNISKVKINDARKKNKVRNTLNTLTENIVSSSKSILKSYSFFANILKSFIRNNNKRINLLSKSCNTLFSLSHSTLAFKLERLCDNTDCEDTHFSCNLSNDRSRTCASATAHACGNEYHISILECISDFISALVSSLLSDRRHRTCTLAMCNLIANLNLLCSL